MDIVYCRLSTAAQAAEVEELNRANLQENVADESQGFITILYPAALLLRLATVCAPIIALHAGKVVGFLILMPIDIGRSVPELARVVAPLQSLQYRSQPLSTLRFLRCGPVCVAREFRGRHIARGLYEQTRSLTDFLVTRVNEANTASLKAHLALGFARFHLEKGKIAWVYLLRASSPARL